MDTLWRALAVFLCGRLSHNYMVLGRARSECGRQDAGSFRGRADRGRGTRERHVCR